MQADKSQIGLRGCGGRRRRQQLGADEHRPQAADEEEREDGDHVLHADDLVVRGQPEIPREAAALPVEVRLVVGRGHRTAQ